MTLVANGKSALTQRANTAIYLAQPMTMIKHTLAHLHEHTSKDDAYGRVYFISTLIEWLMTGKKI